MGPGIHDRNKIFVNGYKWFVRKQGREMVSLRLNHKTSENIKWYRVEFKNNHGSDNIIFTKVEEIPKFTHNATISSDKSTIEVKPICRQLEVLPQLI